MVKKIRGEPISMVVEWGQLESGLNAIQGAMRGVAGKQTIKELGPRLRDEALKDFGQRADALSMTDGAGSIAHTYEWGMAGSPAGRLWYAIPTNSGASGGFNFAFRDSIKPVPLGGTQESDRRERALAADKNIIRATHIWKRKASDQEFRNSWTVVAGQDSPETLSAAGSSSPTKFLRILQDNGEILYRKRWRNYSEYTGNFTAFFEGFWSTEAPQTVEREINTNFIRRVQPQIEREITNTARGRGMIRPGMTLGPGTVKMFVNGKPFTGTFASVPNKAVEKKIRKHMKETWG